MKKLMIAALVAAMGGVAMADCAEPAGCAYAYRMKLAGKCTTSKYKDASSACAEGNCWVKPKSYRVAGYLYNAAECGDEACCPLSDGFLFHFWDANKDEVKFEAVEIPVYDVLRNGGAMDKAQLCIKLDELVLAGFGSYKPSKNYLLSANGFFAGLLPAPQCNWKDAECEDQEAVANVFAPCGLEQGEAANGIAYGRWSLTYKAEHSAKLKAAGLPEEGYPSCLLPTGFTYAAE